MAEQALSAETRTSLESVARDALHEVTPARTVGALRDIVQDGDVATVTFSPLMGGYPGWVWTVSVSTIEPDAPSVLETELIPSDGALTAPDWVPWADRLEEYLAHQAELADEESDEDDDSDDDDSDDDHADEHDLHEDHDADVFDGLDIDAHDEPVEVDDDNEFNDDSDDSEDDRP